MDYANIDDESFFFKSERRKRRKKKRNFKVHGRRFSEIVRNSIINRETQKTKK